MNPVEILGLRATADKQASREIRTRSGRANGGGGGNANRGGAVEMAAVAGIGGREKGQMRNYNDE